MLYVSKRYSSLKYGIVDTDDGQEEVYTAQELAEIVDTLGIEIKGVTLGDKIYKNGKRKVWCTVKVWQAEESLQKSQVKLKVLVGVDVKTNGSEITGLSWKHFATERPVRLRLSDYGDSCAEYLLADIQNFAFRGAKFLTIVLDDKIALKAKSFKHAPHIGVRFDLSEVTNKKTVEIVYKELISDRSMSQTLLKEIVTDKPDRLDFYRAVTILNNGYKFNEKNQNIQITFPDNYEEISAQITKKYKPEFLAISRAVLQMRSGTAPDYMIRNYVGWLVSGTAKDMITCYDYTSLRYTCMDSLFRVIGQATTCNANVMERYKFYIKHFVVDGEMKGTFINFVHKLHTFMLSYCEKRGYVKMKGHDWVEVV